MGKYIKSKLTQRDLVDIISKCGAAVKKGYITDDPIEQQWIDEVRQNRDFEWFIGGRKKAQEDYDEFCRNLEEILPQIEIVDDPTERLDCLLPLYEKALLLDGRRRGFDITYKQPDNILDFYFEELKNIVECKVEQQPEELLRDLLALYPHESYASMEMKDFLQLLRGLRLAGATSDSLSYSSVFELTKNMQANALIKRCLRIYCQENLETLVRRLMRYKDYFGEEDKILAVLEERREITRQAKFVAIEAVEDKLSESEKITFRATLHIVNTLMYFDSCEDIIRHTVSELADYFLRENVAKTLCELGIIPTPEPADYPQRVLLNKVKAVITS